MRYGRAIALGGPVSGRTIHSIRASVSTIECAQQSLCTSTVNGESLGALDLTFVGLP